MKKTSSVYSKSEYIDKQALIIKKYKNANKWFWSALLRYPFHYLAGFLLLIVSTYLSVNTTALIGTAFDYLHEEGFSVNFNKTIFLMLIFVLLSWISQSLSVYVWAIASFRIQRDMRQEFYEVIQQHSMAFFDINDSGVILSMGMNEINSIRMAFNPALRMLLSSVVGIIISIFFLWRADFYIGISISIAFIIYFVIAWIYAGKVGPIRKKLATDLSELSSLSQEMFKGIDTVRSFDNEENEIAKFEHVSYRYAEDMKKEGYLSAFYWPALITVVFTAGAFAYGSWMVVNKYFTIGTLVTILALLMSLNRQNFMIPARLIMLQGGIQNAKRLWDKISFQDPLIEPSDPLTGNWNKGIEFRNVNFAYPGTKKYSLIGVSFNIPAGARVALIGGPGSGKSTILKLLLRLYDPNEGTIFVNGTPLNQMHTKYIRQHVTLVEQEIFLFSDTIKANISFSKQNATEEEIKIAAERAQIAQFIESLPQKYDTVIGERGVTLSGGQRQRIAIARALLSDPKLLLLDDSTSAVDIKTELRLRYAMEELMKGRTSIVVTQRLTTLVEADMIILMKKGKVVDIGTHEELLSRCEEYQFMCKHLPINEGLEPSVAESVGGGK
ncbi:MAG: ABC transporter ATP-binding protein/permease [Candidatus Heimdallarchaeum endolithica]|uniref:ABC transporter ATP-binding protein/permease n=1 Tax=Candidatus Heimdallarchaeum endolithica TaxID=2876572 RepID=A0A9Y1BS47_9ARCH|nr:MAG: ABC transporter ATP-binding protein/permease [Candidatus Heimdallarchaeum endolithica]